MHGLPLRYWLLFIAGFLVIPGLASANPIPSAFGPGFLNIILITTLLVATSILILFVRYVFSYKIPSWERLIFTGFLCTAVFIGLLITLLLGKLLIVSVPLTIIIETIIIRKSLEVNFKHAIVCSFTMTAASGILWILCNRVLH